MKQHFITLPHRVKVKIAQLCLTLAKLLQSCPTLCDPIDGSPPGSAVPGILQARTLEWVAISFSTSYEYAIISLRRTSVTPRFITDLQKWVWL